MRFIVALVVSFALVWACAKPLKKHPVPFYVGAVALVVLYFWGVSAGVRGEAWSYFQPLMQRCALAFLLFTVVMFVGVLGEGNPLRTHLMPIRRQLSILACIFACGHIAFYGASYLPRLASAFSGNLAFSLGLAALITALMAVLWVTSAKRVKHAMTAVNWKRVQRLAYPFYLLTYVHLALLLMPSAAAGNSVAVLSIAVYSIVMGAYVVLRLRKAAADRLAEPAAAASDLDLEAAPAYTLQNVVGLLKRRRSQMHGAEGATCLLGNAERHVKRQIPYGLTLALTPLHIRRGEHAGLPYLEVVRAQQIVESRMQLVVLPRLDLNGHKSAVVALRDEIHLALSAAAEIEQIGVLVTERLGDGIFVDRAEVHRGCVGDDIQHCLGRVLR